MKLKEVPWLRVIVIACVLGAFFGVVGKLFLEEYVQEYYSILHVIQGGIIGLVGVLYVNYYNKHKQ